MIGKLESISWSETSTSLTILSEFQFYITEIIAGKIRSFAIGVFRSTLIVDSTWPLLPTYVLYHSRSERRNAIGRVTNDAWSDHRDRIVRTIGSRGTKGEEETYLSEKDTSVRNDTVPNETPHTSLVISERFSTPRGNR